MSFPTSIQLLTGADVLGGGKLGVDWARDRAWNLGNTGVSRINILSGNEDAFGLYSAYGDGTTWIFMGNFYTIGTDGAGNVYTSGAQLNNDGIVSIDGNTLALLTSDPYPELYNSGGNYASVPYSGFQFILDTTPGGPFGFQRRINTVKDGLAIDNASWPNSADAQSTVVGSGKVGESYGYLIISENAAPQRAVVNKIVVSPAVVSTTINTLVPTDINVAWTTIQVLGMCTDQGDGHPMLYAASPAAAVKAYIVKIDKDAGTVIWKTPLPNVSTITGMWNQSIVEHGKLYVLTGSPNTITTIDTTDGSSSSYASDLAGIIAFSIGQTSSDILGAIVLNCDFTETTGSPTRLNSTPASFVSQWSVLYVAEPYTPPPPPVSPGRKWMAVLGPVKVMTLGPAGVRGSIDLDIEVAGVPGSAVGAAGAVSLDIAVAGSIGSSTHGTIGLNIAVAGVVGGATGGLLKTLQVENFGVSDSSPESHTPMFGLGFKEGDMPSGQWPVLKTAGGTVVPYSAGARGSWPDGSLKFLPGLARFPDQITGLAQASLRVFAGGSAPVASSRTLAELYALNISVLGNGGLDNISGDWTCALQAANVISVTVIADGPAGKVWEFLANFNRLGSAHGQLVTVFYLQALEDAGGLLAGVRILPRITQPWYDWDTPPKNFRSFTSLQLQYGPVGTIYDAMANSYSPKTFTWENAGSGGDLLLSTGYGYPGGLAVRLSTTGVLPAGLSTNTTYWIAQNSSNDFYFADGASVGSINNGVNRLHVTSFGSGTHTMTPVPYVSHFCSAWIATTEAKYVWLNGAGSVSSEATLRIRNDIVYDHSTRILPPYDLSIGTVANNTSYFWGPYAVGPLLLFIGTTGERGDIGVLSAYHSRHFYTQAAVDERLARIIGLAQGNLPTNLRDHTLRNLLNFSNNSYFGMSASVATTVTWRPGSVTAGFTPPLNPSSYTQCFSGPDESHQTQFSAYPYFITGEPQFYALLKEASGEANFGPPPNDRNATVGGTTYYGIGPFAKDSFRSGAWCFREIVWTAVLSPDSDPDGSGFSTYVRDLAAAQFSYLAAWNLVNSSWWNTNGFWAPQSCGNARASWQVGYVWSVVNLGAGGLHNSDALAMSFHLAKWPAHVNSLTGNTWCLGSYYEISSSSAGVQGAPYITGDLLWGPFSPNSGLSWTNAGDLLTWSGTNFTNSDGDKLVFWANAPAGLSLMTPYYAVSTSGTSFQLAASPGGSALPILADGAVGDSIYLAAIPASPPVGGFVGSGPGYSTYGSIQQGNVNWAIALGATGLSAAAADLNSRQAGAPYGLDPRYTMQTTF